MAQRLNIHTIVSMPFAENTYLLWREGSREALVIDPGLEPEAILEALQQRGLQVAAILNTHGHADHIAGNAAMKEAFPNAPLLIGRGDAPMLTDPWANLSAGFGIALTSPPADRLLAEGDIVEAADIRLEVLDIPGHSPGHVVFIYRDNPCRILGGDVLFRASIGRTDFPGGDHELLLSGIRRKLFPLPPESIIHPGHGPETTIGYEKANNPFVGDPD
jgi:glyoxylase-like metal-dependent hydrolase (beta-lactamase superfamily II)